MTDPEHIQQERDLVPGLRMLRLAGAAIFVAALGVSISWLMLRRGLKDHANAQSNAGAAFQAGTPERTPIETSERGLALRQAQQKQLAQYGWVDRDAGIARIPIERAIELRVESAR